MAQVSITTSKSKFQTGDAPSQADFIDLHDSVVWYDTVADKSFETLTYSATPSVTYNPLRPNKKYTLTGNIAITNTSTSNGASGIYEFVQDGTGNRTVSINGTSITINPAASSPTLVGWFYDGSIYTYDVNYTTPSSNGSFDPSTSFIFFEDFMDEVTAHSADLQLTISGGGGGQIGFNDVNHPGIFRIYSNGTGTRAYLGTNPTVLGIGGGVWNFEALIQIPTLSNSTDRFQTLIGFISNNSSIDQAHGVYFLYDNGGVTTGSSASTNWQTVSAAGGTKTFNTGLVTTVVAVNTWYKLKIIINAAGTQADFYINNTLVATHTANIPTLGGFGMFIGQSAGAGLCFISVDYMSANSTFTTPR